MKTILFDFDGVIHDHTKNAWESVDTIKGQPVEGMKNLISELREEYKIIIYSSRCLEGRQAIIEWIDKEGIIVDGVTNEKLPYASMIVDDRGINFDGNIDKLREKIRTFEVWTKKKKTNKKLTEENKKLNEENKKLNAENFDLGEEILSLKNIIELDSEVINILSRKIKKIK